MPDDPRPPGPELHPPSIASAQQLFTGSEPGDLGPWLSAIRSGTRYALGSTVPLLTTPFAKNAAGVEVPERLSRHPQPGDVLRTYLTARELGLEVPMSAIIARLRRSDILTVLRVASELASDLEDRGIDEDRDRRMASILRQPARGRAEEAIVAGRALLTAQAAMLLIKLALTYCPRKPMDQPEDANWLLLACLGIQDALGKDQAARTSEPPMLGIVGDARAVAALIQTQYFLDRPEPVTMLAHSYLRWRELPSRHGGSPDFVDLEAAFETATGVAIDDFVTVGLAMWAQRLQQRSAVLADDSLGLPMPASRIRRVTRLIAASPTYLARRIRSDEQQYGWAWSFDPLRQFPVVRLRGGRLIIVSPALVLRRVFSLIRWDVEFTLRARGETRLASRARGFWDSMCEEDAIEAIASFAPSAGLAKRLYNADELKAAYGHPSSSPKLADFAIEYPDAWLVGDVTSSTLSREAVVGGSLRDLDKDLARIVDAKAAQLQSTIDELARDESRLTGAPARSHRRFVPVVLAAEGFPVNAATSEHIWARLRARNLLQGPKVAPLRILDTEDLTVLEGLTAQGVSALDILERHASGTFRGMSLVNFVTMEARLTPAFPQRLRDPFDHSWQPIFRAVSDAVQGGVGAPDES